jgi:hypothetical protein
LSACLFTQLIFKDTSFFLPFQIKIDSPLGDIDKLMSYGVIKIKQGKYVAFSGHFQAFLDLIGRDIDLWPLVTKTELLLRVIIADVLYKVYGEQWFGKLNTKYPKLGGQDEQGRNLFQRCLILQQADERTKGSGISQNPLDYSYPRDLINIINVEWAEFKFIFEREHKKDKKYWNSRFNLFVEVRAPLAHNRTNLIKDHERRTAEGYCMEILEVLHAYLSESGSESIQ